MKRKLTPMGRWEQQVMVPVMVPVRLPVGLKSNQCCQGFRGPDFFAVFNVDRTRECLGWVVWEEA
jgi:hypothetical protein